MCYPQLWAFLGKGQNTRCPDCISLGPEGSYFINVAGNKSFQCHPNAQISLSAQLIKCLWWGVEGSFVVEYEDGQVDADLRGHYAGLEDLLQSRDGKPIKVSRKHTRNDMPHTEKLIWEIYRS